jgi:hypothetical protein
MTTLTATVPAIPPVAPADSIHTATQATITWRWHVVPGALGYKWNTTNNYVTAIDLGTTTMMTETMAPAAPFISVTYGHTMVADNQWWTR